MASLGLLGAIGGLGKGLSDIGSFEIKRQAEEEKQLRKAAFDAQAQIQRDAAAEARARVAAKAKAEEADALDQVKAQRGSDDLARAENAAMEVLGEDADRSSSRFLRETWNQLRTSGASSSAIKEARLAYEKALSQEADLRREDQRADAERRRGERAQAADRQREEAAEARARRDEAARRRDADTAQLNALNFDMSSLQRKIDSLTKEVNTLSGKAFLTDEQQARLDGLKREIEDLQGDLADRKKQRDSVLSGMRPASSPGRQANASRSAAAARSRFFDQLPPPGKKGALLRNTDTGEILISNGQAWVPRAR